MTGETSLAIILRGIGVLITTIVSLAVCSIKSQMNEDLGNMSIARVPSDIPLTLSQLAVANTTPTVFLVNGSEGLVVAFTTILIIVVLLFLNSHFCRTIGNRIRRHRVHDLYYDIYLAMGAGAYLATLTILIVLFAIYAA